MILGTGKMARNIGAHLLRNRYAIVWVSRSEERLEQVKKHVGRVTKRLARLDPTGASAESPTLKNRFVRADRAREHRTDVIIETTSESLSTKRSLIETCALDNQKDALWLTNSSSLLPTAIGAGFLGMHFFYPIELTGFVEIVIPETRRAQGERAVALANSLNLHYVTQSESNAFAANRLLLPLQSEMIKAIERGIAPEIVNRCSMSNLLPLGQLQLMDVVGLDTILSSVQNYRAQMVPKSAEDFSGLERVLRGFVEEGRTGQKANNGLLAGGLASFDPDVSAPYPGQERELARRLHLVFLNTCLEFIDSKQLTRRDLDTILARVMQAEEDLETACQRENPSDAAGMLSRWYEETGTHYLRPSAVWQSGDASPQTDGSFA